LAVKELVAARQSGRERTVMISLEKYQISG